MFATNIDAETTDEKVQALLDYLNEENGTKLKKEILRLKNSRIQNQALYIILHLVHIKLCFLCFMLVRLLILKGENLWIIIL